MFSGHQWLDDPPLLTDFLRTRCSITLPPTFNDYIVDPRILYDKTTQRWYYSAIAFNLRQYTWAVLAVSNTEDPLAEWSGYYLWPPEINPNGVYYLDFEVSGYSSDKIVISSAIYAAVPEVTDSWCMTAIINKEKIVSQRIFDVQYITEHKRCYFFPVSDINGESSDALSVTVFDYPPLGPTGERPNRDYIYINTYSGLPPNVQVSNKTLSISPWKNPTSAPSSGDYGSGSVYGGTFFGLSSPPVRRDNVIYIAQPVGIGFYDPNGFRVYKIDALTQNLTFAKEYSTSSNKYYIYPSIAAAGDGSFAVGYTFDNYLSAGMMRVDKNGNLTCKEIQPGTGPIKDPNGGVARWGKSRNVVILSDMLICLPRHPPSLTLCLRFSREPPSLSLFSHLIYIGDYSGTVEDPEHPGAFCTFQEFAYSTGGIAGEPAMSISCTCPQTLMTSCDLKEKSLL